MDPERFDALTRTLGTSKSRRSAMRLLGSALALAGLAPAAAADASPRGRRHAQSPDAPAAAHAHSARHHPKPCDPGLTRCKTRRHKHACVDLQTDSSHCGKCSQRCDADQVCQDGTCGPSNPCDACRTDQRCCNGTCVSGNCCGDTDCGAHARCSSTNQCVCDAGFHRCGTDCVSDDDVDHCGSLCAPCPSAACSTAKCDGTTCGLEPIAGCCRIDSECGVSTDCSVAVCDASTNTCIHRNAPAGTPTTTQTPGDCQQTVCDGNGGTMTVADDADLPVDGNECTADLCVNGVPIHPALPAGTPCAQNGGSACDGAGQCV